MQTDDAATEVRGGAPAGPSPERVRAVEARRAALQQDLVRLQRARRPVRGARVRVALWSLAIVLLFAALRPGGVARAAGIEARLLAGAGTVGGHRLTQPGQRARAVPGDVVTASEDPAGAAGARVEIAVGEGRLTLAPGARLLVERLGPPSIRLLAGELAGLGPLALQTAAGTLVAPLGVSVEVRRAPGGGLEFLAHGPGATLTDALGVHALGVGGP